MAVLSTSGRGAAMTSKASTTEPVTDWTPPSWDEIVSQHSARVYRLAYRLTGNPPAAEPLTQEVFVRVFRSLSTSPPAPFGGWLPRIPPTLSLDQPRRKAKIRFDALTDDADARIPSRAASPDVTVMDGMFD